MYTHKRNSDSVQSTHLASCNFPAISCITAPLLTVAPVSLSSIVRANFSWFPGNPESRIPVAIASALHVATHPPCACKCMYVGYTYVPARYVRLHVLFVCVIHFCDMLPGDKFTFSIHMHMYVVCIRSGRSQEQRIRSWSFGNKSHAPHATHVHNIPSARS